MGAEELTFSTATVVQLLLGVAALASAWFYLQGRFDRLADTTTNISKTLEKLDKKVDSFGDGLEEQAKTIVRIEAHGSVMEERLNTVAQRVEAIARPR